MKRLSILFLASLAALNLDAAVIGIGDPAPALKISKWVKGGAITNLDSNKTYVVEFWATWCGPCKVSIPHLTEMAHEFTNITFVGVDVFENGGHKDALVSEFVTKMGDKMDYHVGMDTEDAFMADNLDESSRTEWHSDGLLDPAGRNLLDWPPYGIGKTSHRSHRGNF
jgi:thiol-disulfide isomerase/thioredoxin